MQSTILWWQFRWNDGRNPQSTTKFDCLVNIKYKIWQYMSRLRNKLFINLCKDKRDLSCVSFGMLLSLAHKVLDLASKSRGITMDNILKLLISVKMLSNYKLKLSNSIFFWFRDSKTTTMEAVTNIRNI